MSNGEEGADDGKEAARTERNDEDPGLQASVYDNK